MLHMPSVLPCITFGIVSTGTFHVGNLTRVERRFPTPVSIAGTHELRFSIKQVTQLKAEVERLKKASAPDVEGRRKLEQVVRLLENAFDQKNFKKAEIGTDYFVAPVYLEMLLYKVKEICS